MKNNIIPTLMHKLALILAVLVFGINLYAVDKTDKVEFKVRTTSPGGNFSPKNIGAIWIEDANGNFVRTLQVWAERRIQYLYTWNNRTGANKTDAVTGATLSTHQSHKVSWNVKDANGNDVPNGVYTMRIELTDQHAQGPLGSYTFPVGEATNSKEFADETNFHDIEISWTSMTTDVTENADVPVAYELAQNYPNPFNPTTAISYTLAQESPVELAVYNATGERVATLVHQAQPAGAHSVQFDASALPTGVYLYTITTANFSQTKKMLLAR